MDKNKIKQASIVIILLLFSFYYTNKSIEVIRKSDPIMKQIETTEEKYKIKAQNAKIIGKKIIPGKTGREINQKESYQKMKKYGAYNESLTTFKEITPTISIEDYYDKYIISGNTEQKNVALVFKVTKKENLNSISNILIEKQIPATFFIDGLYIENNQELVKSLVPSFELEILSYDDRYEEIYFNSAVNYLNSLTKKEAKYCYADYDQKEVLEVCQKLKLHTITPTIKVGNYPYKEIKAKLSNAAIISLPVNSSTEIELPSVIEYIRSKGYKFLTLENLLSESIDK